MANSLAFGAYAPCRRQFLQEAVSGDASLQTKATWPPPTGTTPRVVMDPTWTILHTATWYTRTGLSKHSILNTTRTIAPTPPSYPAKPPPAKPRSHGAPTPASRPAKGDLVVYSDAGAKVVDKLDFLFHLTERTGADVVPFRLPYVEKTNPKSPTLFNTSPPLPSTKCPPRSLSFAYQWLHYSTDYRIIAPEDGWTSKENYAGFELHRHDQSVLSVLAKKWNLEPQLDPSQYGKYDTELHKQRTYPPVFDHHRTKE
ncbi:hypothetical protein M427DRAFT_45711 [Gonapodya prolifera JEL478]|uniref:Uncharacterized protein n=1 Tax=Gonapodya prolifera (strain JEL478) TaxID=1344416 RepID=A0A139A9G6_GONPJ|nr:hypothetical protein M427DRAFT_45711 [Gonapodya prolifera JEL478]|eukprot:KXS13387.1 hypothetical protein M427DRAFT_45711 [Gonapodya prolifera JEL478]